MLKVDVLIPVYKPQKQLERILEKLQEQTYPIQKIILMNTEERYFPKELLDKYKKIEVHHIKKAEFDHGGTRDLGMHYSSADIVVCMTQDALPANVHLIGHFVEAFQEKEVWAAYARQLPYENCREIEKYTRSFNYPEESRIKSKADLSALGIKTFFCSNVCAAWRREVYLELGGFAKRTIFNEDMIFAGKLIQQGGKIAYCAKAEVMHSHNYTALQQFHRNFDLAVSQKMHPEIFEGIRSESEGIRLVKKSLQHCLAIKKPWLIFQVVTQSAGKFLGYKMGQNYKKLPTKLVLWCTMNPSFWQGEK